MAAIAAAAIGAAATLAASSASGGGGSSAPKFKPASFSAGGLRANFDEENNNVTVASQSKNAAAIAALDARIAQLRSRTLSAGFERRFDPGQGEFFIDSATGERVSAVLAKGGGSSDELNALLQERERLVQGDTPGFRQGLVNQASDLFSLQAQEIAGLRGQVEPGFGRLSQAQDLVFSNARERFGNQRQAAIGNLRENLSRRRVLGSSFADDAIGRLEGEFSLADRELTAQESETKARTFLQELDLKNNLINQQFTLNRKAVETQLNELNLQADIALQMSTGITSQLGANARLEAQLAAEEARGAGSFFGSITEPVADAVSQFVQTKLNTAPPAVSNIRTDSAGRVLGGV